MLYQIKSKQPRRVVKSTNKAFQNLTVYLFNFVFDIVYLGKVTWVWGRKRRAPKTDARDNKENLSFMSITAHVNTHSCMLYFAFLTRYFVGI